MVECQEEKRPSCSVPMVLGFVAVAVMYVCLFLYNLAVEWLVFGLE